MDDPHPVIEGLRQKLRGARSAAPFAGELESRIRQLAADMVDGRLLPKPEADALRSSILELVRSEALPQLARRNPSDALRVLDKLKAYGFAQLEAERPRLEAARAAKFPPPAPASWSEIVELRDAAQNRPEACKVAPAVENIHFARELADEGLPLPDELLELYAACDGFDLSCSAATYLPVFSLLPSKSIDTSDEEDGYPRRAAVFQGGDEVQLSIYRDRKKHWWLVYEYEYQPIGKKALDVRELLRFALLRMNASAVDELQAKLSWDRFFGITDS
jgi:hypothetical protein